MKKEKTDKRFREKKVWWFRGVCKFLKLIYKKPNFIYVGDKIENGSIILSNHVGTKAPLSMELYLNQPFRFWGAWQMNSNIFKVYGYLAKVYYPEKKRWSKFASYLFSIIAAPVAFLFYRGLNLISIFKGYKFRQTLKESLETIQRGFSIVLFPEDSTQGYQDELQGFYTGFVVLARHLATKGIDAPIVVTYLNTKTLGYAIDNPVKYSELIKKYETPEKIAEALCDRANEIAKLTEDSTEKQEEK